MDIMSNYVKIGNLYDVNLRIRCGQGHAHARLLLLLLLDSLPPIGGTDMKRAIR